MAVPVSIKGNVIETGRPVPLFRTRMYGGGTNVNVGVNYDVTVDGRFLINDVLDESLASITLIQNWKPQSKSR
jgi:hypothetical protein